MKVAKRAPRCGELAGKILGMQLVTHQTGPEGRKVRRLLIEQGADIGSELYVGARRRPRHAAASTFMASTEGGMDIEEVAAQHAGEDPHACHRPGDGPRRPTRREDSRCGLGVPEELDRARRATCCRTLVRASSTRCDCSLAEVNPLVVTGERQACVALDAKINFDDNALFRHPEIAALPRPRRGGPRRGRGLEVRPHLRLARRQHRLPGQRRRPRDGDDGHHQALRRHARRTSSTSAAAPPRRR